MSKIISLFPTLIYRADKAVNAKLNSQLEDAALTLAHEDDAGLKWCEKHGYPGYTSYATQGDFAGRIPAINALEKILDRHAAAFAKAGRKVLVVDLDSQANSSKYLLGPRMDRVKNNIADFFSNEFFETKKVVHLPLKFKI